MINFPNTKAQLLERPFLCEPEWGNFCDQLDEVLASISPGESVLCAETDRVRALAICFASLLKGGGIFFANPNWKENEWLEVQRVARFHRVFGICPVTADSAQAFRFEAARIMIPSGGTSGRIRFCVHTLETLSAAVASLSKFHGGKKLNGINTLPVFHVSGLMPVVRACLTGGLVRMVEWKALEAGDFPAALDEVCSISLVPTQLARLIGVESGIRFLHGMDTIYLGGGAASPDLVRFIRTEKLPVLFVYGMTETAAMVVVGSRGDSNSAGQLWGRPLPGVSLELAEAGEINVETEALFRGYFPDDSHKENYATGDLGKMTLDGQLQVLGRQDFIINSGGEKVRPEEVEAALADCLPDQTMAVTGRLSEEWGEELVAVLENPLSDKVVRDAVEDLTQKLAPHKIPKDFVVVEKIPRTGLGKVDRVALKKLLYR